MKKIKILILMFMILGILAKLTQETKLIQRPLDIKPIEEVQKVKQTQNVPIPEEIQKQLKEKEEQRKQKEKEEKERIEKEKLEEQQRQQEIARAQQKVTSRSGSTLQNINNGNWVKFTATAYCFCNKCCGKSNGMTASGAKAQAGVTVAMPKGYSFGTKLLIKDTNGNLLNNGKSYMVQDRGGAIKGNRIDIFFNSHAEALNFGKKTVYLKVVE